MEMWVRDGAVVARPVKSDGTDYSDKALIDQMNMVKIASSEEGSLIQWNMGCANWASVLFSVSLISICPAPVRIKYFNAGWFEEVAETSKQAASRIETLLFKSDVRFSQRAYLKEELPRLSALPESLRSALELGAVPEENSILCRVDPDTGAINVERIGEQSLMGRVWGLVPISYPAMTGHSYDKVVSRNYFHVLNSGRAHYDQVLASMVMPDGERQWFGYHRVIVPDFSPQGKVPRVKVVCESAPVDIKLL